MEKKRLKSFSVGGQGGININDIIRIGKKLFTFYKKWQRKQKQQQQQQQQHQQQPYQNQYQGGQGGSPYPAPPVGAGVASQQPYQQSHYYGAHEGKPTKLIRSPFLALSPSPSPRPLPPPPLRLSTLITSFTRRPRPLVESTFALSPFSNAYRTISHSFSTSTTVPLRSSMRDHDHNRDGDPDHDLVNDHDEQPKRNYRIRPPPVFDPTSSFPRPAHQLIVSKPPAPRPRQQQRPRISIFHLLPSILRPSTETLVRINDDIFVHFDEDCADLKNYDMSNAQNAHYVELRNKAIHEGDLMAKCFADSQRAYQSGDGNSAHALSVEGKQHQRLKDEYNDQAAEWIFNENNKVQPVGSVDLHGLYVQESIEFTEKAIDNARNQGLSELRVIVGKGNHSPSHVAKLKPAITSLMNRQHLTASLDPHNQGVLIVQLRQQQQGQQRGMITGGDELVRSIGQKEDGGCILM
ncbi:hypothetical protein JCM3766R1_006490 [Sporobolomyces carnicolor]